MALAGALCPRVGASGVAADSLIREQRPIESVYLAEGGYAETLDTYLSPLRYRGGGFGVSGHWSKATPFAPQTIEMEMNGAVRASSTTNPAGNAFTYGLLFNFDWGLNRYWQLDESWRVSAGAAVGTTFGALYMPRNGNNPASAKCDLMLSLRMVGEWNTCIHGFPIRFRDSVTLPSIGVLFSPEYTETYYEIYLGNRQGLVNAGWWGNHFCIDNLLTAELPTGRNRLTVGYRFQVYSSFVNSLNTQIINHSLVVGITLGGGEKRYLRK